MNRQPGSTRHVVVVGGGIAGLSTAWYLLKEARAAGRQLLRVTVLEAQDRWGGKVLTETVESTRGDVHRRRRARTRTSRRSRGRAQLAREVGIGERIIGTNDASRKVYVVNRGRPTPLPDGVLLIVPTKFMPFALSPLISPLGKLRMGLDLVIPAKRDGQDETLAEFVTRRLGREALDKIAEPLMSGIYNAEADKQSVLATFPRFRAHGGAVREPDAGHPGVAAERAPPKPGRPEPGASAAPAKKPSAFQSFAGGTQELTDATVAALRRLPERG